MGADTIRFKLILAEPCKLVWWLLCCACVWKNHVPFTFPLKFVIAAIKYKKLSKLLDVYRVLSSIISRNEGAYP